MDHFPSTHHSARFNIRMIANESVLMSTSIGIMTTYHFHVSVYCLAVLKFLFWRDLGSALRRCPFKIDGISYTYTSVWIAYILSTDEANKDSSLILYPLMKREKFSETEFLDCILSGKCRSPIGMSIFNESFVLKELLTMTHYE